MQKRVVYNFNAQTATESAAENSTDKAVKTSNATGKIKRAFSGKSFKLVVLIVLLFASLFCTICSADWMISQQKVVPNVAGNSIFKFDDLGFGAHVNNGKPTGNYTFNGSSISISMSAAADDGVQNLPDSAIKAQNIHYRVKNCAPDTQPENLSEEFFNSDYTTDLPKDAGTYAVLITSEVTSEAGRVSYGKTIKVFTIAPCPVKIEWSGADDFTYDGTDHRSNITATARTENDAAINVKISFSYKAHGSTTFTSVTEVKNAGTYTATAEISNDNYTISSNEAATFTIGQRQVTVSDWGNTSFTYNGKAQKPEPSFNNVVNGDNLNATVSIEYGKQPINKGDYTAKVTISNDNYKLSGSASTHFTIRPLKIAFDGIIESDYKNGGIALNKELFKGKFKIAETIADASSVDLSTVHNDIIGGTAKNFSGNEDTSKPENGFYSYAFGKNITAGSTYLISNITLDSTSNFELTTKSVYLKYKTEKIGDVYYTIEDAINSNVTGDIILASNSSGTDTYVISAFTSLNYYGNKTFACSKNIIVPHTDGATTYENQKTGQTGNVGSVLIIPNGVSLTMNSSSLNILAVISQNNTTNTCTSAKRGVVMNQGSLTVKNQIKSGKNIVPNILAYGYLKGNGNVNVENGATVQDLFHLYDFKGGVITYGIHKNTKEYMPINSYSIHNISCNVRVNTGCVYNTYYEITMGGEWFGGIIPVVSTADSAALFKLSSGYIEKRAIPAESATWKNKKDSTGITYGESLDKIKGSNQLAGQKEDIRICGTAVDGSIKITVTLKKILSVDMETGTNNPLPVPYMDIRVCNGGDLSLVNSSYKFMPGSSLTVDNGGKLTLSANAKLVLYSVEDCSVLEAPVTYKKSDGTITSYPYSFITRYCIDKVDAYLLINSNNVTLNGGISGKIISEKSGIKLEIKKDSADITVLDVVHDGATRLWPTNFYYADVTTRNASSARPMKPCGNIIKSYSTAEESFFSAGTYYSTKIDSDYVWFKNSATITYHTNGGTLNGTSGNTTQNITLPSGGYISSNLPEPTLRYHEFNGWYYDSALTQKATAIFASCDLYAGWTPIQYTIEYKLPYKECGTLVDGSLSGTEVKPLATPPQTITVDGTKYTFSGWYLNPDRTGDPITEVSAVNANGKNIYVYAFYRGGTYTVKYNENPENLKFANNLKVDKPENQTFDKGKAVSQSELKSLNSYNENTSFDYYFAGWYLSTDSTETIIKSLPNTINDDITLCAKWIAKHIVTINFTSNDSILETENRLGTIVKYYKDGEVNLQNLYNDNSIAAKIDEYYAPHGNIKEYTLIEWQENGTVITTNVVNVTRNFDITAYHKRCYYITVQKLNATVNGITGGLGTFYASPLDTTFATAITCTLMENKERYTLEYSAINASVDANGVISFANSNSAENVIVNITTQHWFMVDNQYTRHITLKLNSGRQEGNWFTENANITVTLKANTTRKTAIIQKNDGSTQTLTATFWDTDSKDITISGWYIIKNA